MQKIPPKIFIVFFVYFPSVYCATPLRPFVTGTNDKLVLAPYNFSYKNHFDDLNRAGLASSPNLWNKPMVMSEEKVELLKPDDFYYYTIPFELEQDKVLKKFVFPLSEEYSNAIMQKETVQKKYKSKLKVTYK